MLATSGPRAAVTALRERLDPGKIFGRGFHSPFRADIPFCLWTRQPIGRNELHGIIVEE